MRVGGLIGTVMVLVGISLGAEHARGAGGTPVFIGLDAEFGYKNSTSAEAIRLGMQIAIEEINLKGGVLGGRPLAIEERANHSVPARSIENIKELAKIPDLVAAAERIAGVKGPRAIASPVGVAHAYDLTHLLARAIDKAGSTDRAAIRTALENLGPYDGLIKNYPRPFTSTRHEALAPEDVFMAEFAADGAIVRITPPRR